MMTTASEVIAKLSGKTLVTAESLTGGGIGAALTAVPGASRVMKGGIISYTNAVKQEMLGVSAEDLQRYGAVSTPVAIAMAQGARKALRADVAVSATGLAGPGGDEFDHPVGTVFLGYADAEKSLVRECHFSGDREMVRIQTIEAALSFILANL